MEVNGRMKTEYKKGINQIHAPEYLIQHTIHTIEQETVRQKRIKKNEWILLMATVAGVVLLLFIGTRSSSKLIYNEVMLPIVRVEQATNKEETIHLKEYETYLGEDLSHLLGENKAIKERIIVTYTGKDITSDQATFYYDVDGQIIIIQLSKTKEIASNELLQGKMSQVDGFPVILGKEKTTKRLLATGEKNEIYFYMSATGLKKEQFECNLKLFLKNFLTDETK